MIRQLKSDRIRARLMNLSPWILAIACTLLLVLLTVFAFQNYQREKALMVEGLGQRAMTLLRFIDSSMRTSIRQDLRASKDKILWEEHMQSAMDQAVEQPGVEFVLLTASSGKILAGAGSEVPSETLDTGTLQLAKEAAKSEGRHFIPRIF